MTVTEDTNSHRIRRIKWAIAKLTEKQGKEPVYRIQFVCGFWRGNKEIKLSYIAIVVVLKQIDLGMSSI